MERIGIYPGSFDPVHHGHIAFAEAAIGAGQLGKVVFLPEERPRGKPQISPVGIRVSALRLRTAQSKQLQVVKLPIERFTVAGTLPLLQSKFSSTRLTLLVGSDIVHTFQYRWPGLETLLRSVDLIIGLRSDDTAKDMKKIIAALEARYNYKINHLVVATPHAHLASSKIRRGIIKA